MISTLAALRPKLPQAALAAGASISIALIVRQNLESAENEKEIPHDYVFCQPVNSSWVAPNIASCDFFAQRPRVSRLARSRTVRRLKETSTRVSLRSKYDVQWRQPLGEGGFGAVYLATDKRTGELVAVKKISNQLTTDSCFQKEMNAFLHIRDNGGHPHICGLRENFKEGDDFYLVLDLVSGGEMFDHLCSQGAYSEADAARLVREIGSALAFIHGIGCVHGDMKPENLMLSSESSSDAVIKLVDFGCAQVIDKASPLYQENEPIAATTPGYSPPEVVSKSLTRLEPSVDMFSLGVIIYIMLTGMHPFDLSGTSTDQEMNELVRNHKPPPLRKAPVTAHLSPSAIDLIERLMHWNPNKRLTALQMLDHPWVRGDTARKGKIADSDKRLQAYRKYKSSLEAKVFQSMVKWSDSSKDDDVAKKTSLIERSFQMLDEERRGYITTKTLKKLDPAGASDSGSSDDDSQLSLSGFSDLLSENMKNRYFPAGHVIYREGARGNNMYFINSGRVECTTKSGFSEVIEQGDFFGEGALFDPSGRRSASIKSLTPVHVIEVTRQYFEKFLADGYDTKLDLRVKDKMRKRNRARSILSLQKNMTSKEVEKGEYIFKEGDQEKELYILEEGQADVMVDNHTVFSVHRGELCGEQAVIFNKPRNTSAVCVSDSCKLHVLCAKDFNNLMRKHPIVKSSIRDICFKREFQKALVLATKKPFPISEKELWEAYKAADYNNSGMIDLSDITTMLKQLDSSFTSKDIQEILNSLDLDNSGAVNWEEFKRIFGMSKRGLEKS